MDLPGYRVFENLSCNVITTLTSAYMYLNQTV